MKNILFVVPYNPLLNSNGPQGPKNVSQPLIHLLSTAHNVALVIVSKDESLSEATLRSVFPSLKTVHICRPITGWTRRLARLNFMFKGLPLSLSEGLSRELPSILRNNAISSDLIHFEYFTLATSIKLVESVCPVQLHCHDAYSLHQRRVLEQSEGLAEKIKALVRFLMFRRLERSLISKATNALTVSPVDQLYLARNGMKNVHYLPPALQEIQLRITPKRAEMPVEILCIVSNEYNTSEVNALRSFFRDRFPALRQQVGGHLSVTLLGKSAERIRAELQPFAEVDAEVFVADYYSFLGTRNWIYFYPNRAGAGLHTKLRDAMTARLPVVGYEEIMDAFNGISGEHYISCNSEDQVFHALAALLSNPTLHAKIGDGGHRLLSEKFGPAIVLEAFNKLTLKRSPRVPQENDLPRLHANLLPVARRVHELCEKHGISYFLIAGTLLGAVRHEGFIPWDDDLDIGMLRCDYDRFIAIAQGEFGAAYFVQTYETDPYMPFPYAKIRINGTVMREGASQKCKWNPGISIDVFPFDGVPENRLLRLFHKWSLRAVSLTLIAKCGFTPLNERSSISHKFMYRFVIHPVSWVLPRRLQVSALDVLSRLFSSTSSPKIMATGGSYGYDRETISRNWFANHTPMSFCGTLFNCPIGWRAYLINLYGDYMKPPSKENRENRHNIVELRFNDE